MEEGEKCGQSGPLVAFGSMCWCLLSWASELGAHALGWSLPWLGPGLLGFADAGRELEYMVPVEKGVAEISAISIPIDGY